MKKKLFDAKTIRIILIAILIIASIFTVVFMLRNDESKSGTKTPPQTTQDKEELKDEPTDDKVSSLEVKEVPSSRIGEIVMDELKALDEVAYVRFASVYREFKDVNTFMDELKKILK